MTRFLARSCQIVWFFGDTQHLSADLLLADVVGLQVDSVQRNRTPTMASPFISQATCVQDGLSNSFTVMPGRVDFVVTVAPTDGLSQDVALFDPESVLKDFLARLASGNIKHLNGANRLAVVVNYLRKVDTLSSAQIELMNWLGVPVPTGYVSDLFFQINRRASIFDGSIEINRLLQLRNEVVKLLEMQPASILGLVPTREVNEETFFSIVADVNTIPERPIEVSGADMLRAFNELSLEVLRLPHVANIGDF